MAKRISLRKNPKGDGWIVSIPGKGTYYHLMKSNALEQYHAAIRVKAKRKARMKGKK